MKSLVLFFAATSLLGLSSPPAQAAPAVPFGGHAFTYSSAVIKPNSQTQAQMDTVVGTFYDSWKAAYVSGGCVAGRRRINYDGASQTVSEAHGYGMLAAVLMAGHDAEAQTLFDDFYRYFRAHNATGTGGADMMAWKQDAGCANIEGADTASDGDLDIAMALLMADRQWGSCGAINYKAEGLKVVTALKAGVLDTSKRYVKLGNWVTTADAKFYPSTRSSDFMPSHYRSFKWASGDATWDNVLNTTYDIVAAIQANHSPTTGLIPDFIKNPLSSPAPVNVPFLENDATDPGWGYNACRDPWRLTTDLVASGDTRTAAAMLKIKTFIKTASGGSATNLDAERALNGTVIGNYEEMSFSAPYMVGAMSDPSDQAWLNLLWTRVSTRPLQGYFGDSIKLISLIVASGNWWQPEAFGDPCSTGSPTSTPTRTPSPSATATRTTAVSFTSTLTPSATATRTTAVSFTSTVTPSSTATRTPATTFTSTVTASATATRTTAVSFTPTVTPSVTATRTTATSSTSTVTPSVTATRTTVASFTSTGTASATSTQTPAFSFTPTPSATVTASRTAVVTFTSTATASATASHTAVVTFTATNTASATASRTATAMATSSATPTASATATVTAQASGTPSPAVPSATATSTAAATEESAGPLVIRQALALPNPNPAAVALQLSGSADQVTVKVYSSAYALVASQSGGPRAAGWAQVALPADFSRAPNGTYFFVLEAARGEKRSAPVKGKLVLVR
jgi:hypothetical protein